MGHLALQETDQLRLVKVVIYPVHAQRSMHGVFFGVHVAQKIPPQQAAPLAGEKSKQNKRKNVTECVPL